MKHFFKILFATSFFLLASCQMGINDNNSEPENNLEPENDVPEDLPDVRAFQDAFTRPFLQSKEESEPGYYLFKSETGMFQMNFPADGIIEEKSHIEKNGNFESFLMSTKKDDQLSLTVVTYDQMDEDDDIESILEDVEEKFDTDLDFSESEWTDRTLYLSPLPVDEGSLGYIGLLISDSSDEKVEIIYEAQCESPEETCFEADEKANEFTNWLKSIEFIQEGSSASNE